MHINSLHSGVLLEAAAKMRECEKKKPLLTYSGDNRSSKEKGGTQVPEARLIGGIS